MYRFPACELPIRERSAVMGSKACPSPIPDRMSCSSAEYATENFGIAVPTEVSCRFSSSSYSCSPSMPRSHSAMLIPSSGSRATKA